MSVKTIYIKSCDRCGQEFQEVVLSESYIECRGYKTECGNKIPINSVSLLCHDCTEHFISFIKGANCV